MDVDAELQSGLDTRPSNIPATDFELEDYWDDGAVLGGRDVWPVSVTLNLVPFLPFFFLLFIRFIFYFFLHTRGNNKFPGVYFLDATTQEEAATPLRLILIFSFPAGSPPALHGMHLLGTGDTDLAQIESLVKVGTSALSVPRRKTQVIMSTGGAKVCPRDIHGVERQVERRGPTPDREGAAEVLRGTMNE